MWRHGFPRLARTWMVPLVGLSVVALGLPFFPASATPADPSAPSSTSSSSALKQPEEMPSLRTRTSLTYLNPDGTHTAHLYTGSVNYQDAKGDWQPIDDTLVASSQPGYAVENKANAYKVYLPADLSQKAVQISIGDQWLDFAPALSNVNPSPSPSPSPTALSSPTSSLTPAPTPSPSGTPTAGSIAPPTAAPSSSPAPNAAPTPMASTTPIASPTPAATASESSAPAPAPILGTVASNSDTYANAFAGAALTYWATNDEVKEGIVLSGPLSASTYSFAVQTSPGASLQENSGGGLDFVDSSGTTLASIPAPLMYDSSGTDLGVSSAVSLTATQGVTGTILTVAADPHWLLDPARKWPVVIDPSLQFNTSQDCYISSGIYHTTNNCDKPYVKVGTDLSVIRRTVLQFNLSTIPSLQTVTSADLSLYQTTGASSEDTEVHALTHAWTTGLTWDTYDGSHGWSNPGGDFESTVRAKAIVAASPATVHWFPTTLVQDWLDGTTTNDGLLIKQVGENTNYVPAFASSRDTDPTHPHPSLTVTYTDAVGELGRYRYESQQLNDRMHLHVNVGSGNLVVHANDLAVNGVAGQSLVIDHYYNSLSTGTSSELGANWSLSVGPDVRLEPQANNDVNYIGPSGFRVVFHPNGGACPSSIAGTAYDLQDGVNGVLCKRTNGTYSLVYFSRAQDNFNSLGRFTSEVDRNGNTISFSYNGNGTLNYVTDTHGRTYSFGYAAASSLCPNPTGRLGTITDSAYPDSARVLSYCYDTSGRLTDYFDANNFPATSSQKSTNYHYDTAGRVDLITDPLGKVTKIDYVDASSRKVAAITRAFGLPEAAPWTFAYTPTDTCSDTLDVIGKTVVTDPNSSLNKTTYCYDAKSRVLKVLDAKNKTASATFNSRSNVLTLSDIGQTLPASISYSPSDDDAATVTLPTTGLATIKYTDITNNPHFPTKIYDFQNHNNPTTGIPTYSYTYDTSGNLKTATDAQSDQYQYFYNLPGDGTLDYVLDGRGKKTDYNYWSGTTYNNGDLKEVIPPPGGSQQKITLIPDAESRIRTIVDGKLQIARMTYDELDRVTQVDYWQTGHSPGVDPADSTIFYEYDLDGNLHKRHEATPNLGEIVFDYDGLNRETDESPPGAAANLFYTYWPNGDLKSVKENGETVNYVYNEVNMLTDLTDSDNNHTTFGYDSEKDRLRTTTTYPNGVTLGVAYDNSNRVCRVAAINGAFSPALSCSSSLISGALINYGYSYLDSGVKDTVLRQKATDDKAGTTLNYTYDLVDRLTQANDPATTGIDFSYGYDANSNITSASGLLGIIYRSYDNDNELTKLCLDATCNNVIRNITYDANGNESGYTGGASFGYNVRNQTSGITPAGGNASTMEYQDAGQFRWMSETVGGSTTDFDYTGLGMEEVSGNGSHTTRFVRDNGGTLVELRDETGGPVSTFYYLFDGLGSVVGLTNSAGQLVGGGTYKYSPFGVVTSDPVSSTVANPWQFASGYFDSNTGLLKFGTRYYDPSVARWTQADPGVASLGNPLSLNPYLYAQDNPTNLTDPSGGYIVGGEMGSAPPPAPPTHCCTLPPSPIPPGPRALPPGPRSFGIECPTLVTFGWGVFTVGEGILTYASARSIPETGWWGISRTAVEGIGTFHAYAEYRKCINNAWPPDVVPLPR
jgi:RHS repeat-associated protein